MKRAAMRLLPKDRELGWTPYFWLIYLAVFLVDPLLRPRAVPLRLLTFAVALAFVALYLRAWWLEGRRLGGTVERDGSRGTRIRVILPIFQEKEAARYGASSSVVGSP